LLNNCIFAQGQEARWVYVVLEGTFEITKSNKKYSVDPFEQKVISTLVNKKTTEFKSIKTFKINQ
jgi:hypothetical protein